MGNKINYQTTNSGKESSGKQQGCRHQEVYQSKHCPGEKRRCSIDSPPTLFRTKTNTPTAACLQQTRTAVNIAKRNKLNNHSTMAVSVIFYNYSRYLSNKPFADHRSGVGFDAADFADLNPGGGAGGAAVPLAAGQVEIYGDVVKARPPG